MARRPKIWRDRRFSAWRAQGRASSLSSLDGALATALPRAPEVGRLCRGSKVAPRWLRLVLCGGQGEVRWGGDSLAWRGVVWRRRRGRGVGVSRDVFLDCGGVWGVLHMRSKLSRKWASSERRLRGVLGVDAHWNRRGVFVCYLNPSRASRGLAHDMRPNPSHELMPEDHASVFMLVLNIGMTFRTGDSCSSLLLRSPGQSACVRPAMSWH